MLKSCENWFLGELNGTTYRSFSYVQATRSHPQVTKEQNKPFICEGGIQASNRVGELPPLNSCDHITLLKELSTEIGSHWINSAPGA